jgi:hypothetical protein
MKQADFFTQMTLLGHTVRELFMPPDLAARLKKEGESAYGHIVRSLHHPRGVLVKYRFRSGKREYEGWSHYTGRTFRNALHVGNHIKIVYVKGRPRLSRWVEDDRVVENLPEHVRGGAEKNRGSFGEWVNHFRQD